MDSNKNLQKVHTHNFDPQFANDDIIYVPDAARYLAFMAWDQYGIPIMEAADLFNITPEGVMEEFKRIHPWRYYKTITKVKAVILVANWLAIIGGLRRDMTGWFGDRLR